MSSESLVAYWDTFGTPHEPGDVPFGTFRIGRGQIMGLARVSFRTRTFEMLVDFANRPGGYDLVVHAEDAAGMCVTGTWMDGVRRRNVAKSVAAELRRLCRWIAVEVLVNGSPVSTDPAGREWKIVTGDAWFDLGLDEPLRIYNLGAFVCEFPPSRFGIGGEVVSRRQLALNTARNEILVSTCPVWEEIEKVLERHRTSALVEGVLTKESQRQAVLSMLVRGEVGLAEVVDKPIVTLAGGSVATLREIAKARTLGIASVAETTRGERLNGKGTFVISAASARTMGARGGEDVVGLIRERMAEEGKDHRLAKLRVGNPAIVNVSEEYERRVRAYEIRDTMGDLTRDEQTRLAAIDTGHGILVQALQKAGWRHVRKRVLGVGRLLGAVASTDGKNGISVDSAYLKQCLHSPGGVIGLAYTLVHEYGHSRLKYEDVHDMDFYKAVHDAWSHPGVLAAAWEMQAAADSV